MRNGGFPRIRSWLRRWKRQKRRFRKPQHEEFETRRVLAFASPPNELLALDAEVAFLETVRVTDSASASLLSVSRDGGVEVVFSEDNEWQSRRKSLTLPGPVVAATTTLWNQDAFDDLILFTQDTMLVFTSDKLGNWQDALSVPFEGVLDANRHPLVKPLITYLGNDPWPDLLLTLPQSQQLAVFPGDNQLGFTAPRYVATTGETPIAAASGDFLGDASIDVVIGFEDGSLEFYEGDAAGQLTHRSELRIATDIGGLADLVATAVGLPSGKSGIVVAGNNGLLLLRPDDPTVSEPLIVNGDFLTGLSGWDTEISGHASPSLIGEALAGSGFLQLVDNGSFLTSVSQSFVVPPPNGQSTPTLTFDLLSVGLQRASAAELPDAFEVSLLDAATLAPLIATHDPDSTAFFNWVAGEQASFSADVIVQGNTVTVDLSGVPAETEAVLFFDLIGASLTARSSVTIDNVRVVPTPTRTDNFTVVRLPGEFADVDSIEIGDVDGDGQSDIVVSDTGASSLIVFHSDGSDSYVVEQLDLTEFGAPASIALGPMTSPDSTLDVAVAIAGTSQVVTPLRDAISRGETLPTIDFEFTASGRGLRSGEIVDEQFASLGATFSAGGAEQVAVVFDSDQPPVGLEQLGSPNAAFGGPGVGAGGGSGDGINDQSLGQILVVADEQQPSMPSRTGGMIVVEYALPTRIDEVHLLNVQSEQTQIRLYRADGSLADSKYALPLGENSFQIVTLEASQVVRMEIVLDALAAVAAIVSDRAAGTIPPSPTRFYVVDHSDKASYRYSKDGDVAGDFLISGSGSPRGAATTGVGDLLWVVNTNKQVRIYDTKTDELVGTWRANEVSSPEGIATDGTDIWIVDKSKDRVYRFAGAASRRNGSQNPADSFRLSHGNKHPSGITTDGEFLWVVDERSRRVFVYDRQGHWVNWWNLDPDNADPTGITIAPDSQGVWVVDSRDRRVYEYAQRTMAYQGSQLAWAGFNLSTENRHPQGIADPNGNIAIGDSVSAALTAGEIYTWNFNANAGQSIYVRFDALTGGDLLNYPTTTLLSPSGSAVYSKFGRQANQHNSGARLLSEDGIYTLQMTTPVDVNFQFTLFDVRPPDTQTIDFGISYSGAIESPGVQDHWTFSSTAGAS
ncbi:MAG: hypothetical protein NXI32_04795, partial [bacterium]|nr:hypothetical protein [bacterium]